MAGIYLESIHVKNRFRRKAMKKMEIMSIGNRALSHINFPSL